MQLSDRPSLERWRSADWVAKIPVDDRTVGGILNDEVQIAFRGDGPMSTRELVPLTTGAHELLYGSNRESAHRVIRGMLGALDAAKGAVNLRGMSLSTDEASFATNLLLSNTEAGFFPDSVGANDPAGFEASMVSLIPSVKAAKAQNTSWMDFGPRVSGLLRDVIEHGADAGGDAATEVALTALHELQHSITPPNPNTIDAQHVWLEEGAAETLAWWPGRAAAMRERMGVPLHAGEAIDPWSVPPGTTASIEYAARHRAVQSLLALAGINPTRDDGSPDDAAFDRAQQLLQGDPIERVPRALARAITREHHLDDGQVDTIAGLIEGVDGSPDAVDSLAKTLGIDPE